MIIVGFDFAFLSAAVLISLQYVVCWEFKF